MNGKLLDTNVVVRILNGDEQLINELSKFDDLCTCTIVLGELLYGAAKSFYSENNRKKAIDFCSRFRLLDVTDYVAEVYGTLKNELLSKGNVLPENDIWIAAVALANNMALVTQDKHFERVSNLLLIKL